MSEETKFTLFFFLIFLSNFSLGMDPSKMFENNNYKRRKRMRRPLKTAAPAYSKSFFGDSYPSHLQFRHRNLYSAAMYTPYGR